MKLLVELSVFAMIILCISTETSSDPVMDTTDNLKCRLIGRMKYLRHYGNNKTATLRRQINRLRAESIRLIQERADWELRAISKKINESTGINGSAAKNCFQSAETKVKTLMQSLNTTGCNEIDFWRTTSLQANISLIIKNGHQIIDAINDRIILCISTNGRIFQTCVNEQLGEWRNSAKKFRKQIEDIKKNSTSIGIVHGNVYTTGCFGKQAGQIFMSLLNVTTEAIRCIRDIEKIP